MCGIEIVKDTKTKEPGMELGARLSKNMFDLGLSANLSAMSSFGGIFRIAPPLTITDEELDLGIEIMEKTFRMTEGTIPLYSEDNTNVQDVMPRL